MTSKQIEKLRHDIARMKVSFNSVEDAVRVAPNEDVVWAMSASVLQAEVDSFNAHVQDALSDVVPRSVIPFPVAP